MTTRLWKNPESSHLLDFLRISQIPFKHQDMNCWTADDNRQKKACQSKKKSKVNFIFLDLRIGQLPTLTLYVHLKICYNFLRFILREQQLAFFAVIKLVHSWNLNRLLDWNCSVWKVTIRLYEDLKKSLSFLRDEVYGLKVKCLFFIAQV